MMLQGTSQSRAMGQAREWAHVGDKGLAQQNFWHSRISGTASCHCGKRETWKTLLEEGASFPLPSLPFLSG